MAYAILLKHIGFLTSFLSDTRNSEKMMRKPFHSFYICLIGMALSSCNSQNAPTPDLALTATSDQATQTFLCCTATPDLSAITPAASPFPPPNFGPDVILYRGNTQRTGVYDVPAIWHQPEVKWQTKVNSTLPTSPLVVEDILYTGSSNGKLYALNIETGEEIWSVGGFGQLENAGAVSGDVIVSGGYSQDVRALDRRTGSELWSFTTENLIQATPLIVGNRVYIATYHAVYALDLNSGSLIWEVETGDEDAYTGALCLRCWCDLHNRRKAAVGSGCRIRQGTLAG
jgi:WD40 repeat protein